ncbi:MAG TPA: sugar ABC transporter ATP-binding protein [Clostridiales bacterium]|nr:sugar ABC transporter ATP-binding protein [Clostridiales bacterium]
MTDNILLSLQGLTKRYPGVVANNNISLDIFKGEVHTLIGENGAGKSTLIKALSGAVIPDEGTICWEGKEFSHMTPKGSKELGIEIVYQELCLVEALSIAENICLGEVDGVFVDYKSQIKIADNVFREMGIKIDPRKKVGDLTTAKQQLVEIAKAISKGVKLLVLDEPTAPLTSEEIDNLFLIIEKLKKQGVSIIYISHRMDEVFRVSDRITVLRDGEVVKTLNANEVERESLIKLMVDRDLKETFPERTYQSDENMLEIKNLTGNSNYDINLYVKKGEIVGLGGLLGAGRTELARMIYGVDLKKSGQVFIEGKEVNITSPRSGIAHHIGFIPEDRKHQGVLLTFGIDWNITISILKKLSPKGFMGFKKMSNVVEEYISKLLIAAPAPDVRVECLSGGNQQKVVIAKALTTESKLIIFDEPTRGIDVGAKQEIYRLMADLVNEGKSILLISSDMEELLGMSDRIYVLADGCIAGEIDGKEASQVKIMHIISDAMEKKSKLRKEAV